MVGVLLRNNSRVDEEEILAHPLAYEMVLGINEGLEVAGYMMAMVRLSDVDPCSPRAEQRLPRPPARRTHRRL
jgi:hypothetical protein